MIYTFPCSLCTLQAWICTGCARPSWSTAAWPCSRWWVCFIPSLVLSAHNRRGPVLAARGRAEAQSCGHARGGGSTLYLPSFPLRTPGVDLCSLREAELKHCRVAMLAVVGLLAQEAGFVAPEFVRHFDHAMLCYANLCCVMLPCVVLCYVESRMKTK